MDVVSERDLSGLADGVARDTGKTLSDDAVYLLRLAVYLGAARATERGIPLEAYASWRNLLGAALLAPDATSRWLQVMRHGFDTDEILPTEGACFAAIRAACTEPALADSLESMPRLSSIRFQRDRIRLCRRPRSCVRSRRNLRITA